jgi:pantoate--beta-alanine ligase
MVQPFRTQIVEQESLAPVERIDRPSVICAAAWFGNARLIDNIEIQAPS